MKIHRPLLLTTIFFSCIVACKSAHPGAVSPSVNPTDLTASMASTQSRTIRPSATNTRVPSPTLTSTKTPYPWPDLHTAGPYLFIPIYDPTFSVNFYEIDGSGRRKVDFQEEKWCSFSSNLHWCAYTTGNYYDLDGSYPEGGLVLYIFDLWNGTSIKVADIIPKDYIDRLEKVVEKYNDSNPEYPSDISAALQSLKDSLSFYYDSWSPDGRYFAFPAMIDGISTDVYLYDLDTGLLQRMEDDDYNDGYIQWSPDGQWILYNQEFPLNSTPRMFTPYHSIRIDSTNNNITLTDACGLFTWISDYEFLNTPCNRGCGSDREGPLFMVDIRTGNKIYIWDRDFYSYGVDTETNEILIIGVDPCEGNQCYQEIPGLYTGPIFGEKERIDDWAFDKYIFFFYRKGKSHRFLGLSSYDGFRTNLIYGISKTGGVEKLIEGDEMKIKISPDYLWMVVFSNEGIILFNDDDKIVFQKTNLPVYNAEWNTNSEGLFYTTDTGVFYLPTNDLNPKLRIECNISECNKDGDFYFVSNIFIRLHPDLHTRPPRIDYPSEGKSFWSRVPYKDLTQPGTNEYDVTIPARTEWRWNFSWCATTPDGLAQALSPLEVEFLIGGEKVGEDAFRMYDHAEGGWQCRTWAILMAGWQPGDSTDLEIRYTLTEPVNDGKTIYPAGEYRQIIHLTVE